MIWLDSPTCLISGVPAPAAQQPLGGTIAKHILDAHGGASVTFDALISHDITYVGIVQTARASGMRAFPVPYAFTNCHNSLCAVGGTINEDDHAFGLSAARKYGGIYVPANLCVIHQYARERMAAAGGMLLGSDSHTRYGALGCLGVGEGGPELVRQLLGQKYELKNAETVLVYLTGAPRPGVGPHDLALALCARVYKEGLFKNKILEFVGPGVANLSMDFRIGVDVMTTETACLSSVWQTDGQTRAFFARHGRAGAFRALTPDEGACYSAAMLVDLGEIEPMIAFPFHPSNAFPIRLLRESPKDVLREAEKAAGLNGELLAKWTDKGLKVDQCVIAGCAGGLYENLARAACILDGASAGNLSVYPASVPVSLSLLRAGVLEKLMDAGAVIKPCFCGPCFGAGDVPANGALSIRHTTRNFPYREGAKPGEGQRAYVALMDAQSIAASARAGGYVTGADTLGLMQAPLGECAFDPAPYEKRVYMGVGAPMPDEPLVFGPNIADWPEFTALPDEISLTVCASLNDPVTTTDELIPSGETSSYRSNPARLSEYALSRRDPDYVPRAKAVRDAGGHSAIYAVCPGDGSAREQAASCQRVLGGRANIARAYATRRYRANLINWGILPFVTEDARALDVGDTVYLHGLRDKLRAGETEFAALVKGADGERTVALKLPGLSPEEAEILLDGCLINHSRKEAART